MTSGYFKSYFMAVMFTFIGRMPLLAPTLDNADPYFALVMTTGFNLHDVVADQDPASGCIYKQI